MLDGVLIKGQVESAVVFLEQRGYGDEDGDGLDGEDYQFSFFGGFFFGIFNSVGDGLVFVQGNYIEMEDGVGVVCYVYIQLYFIDEVFQFLVVYDNVYDVKGYYQDCYQQVRYSQRVD